MNSSERNDKRKVDDCHSSFVAKFETELQYPPKVSGHLREAYAKTTFSLGCHGYNFEAILMKFALRVRFSRKNTDTPEKFYLILLGLKLEYQVWYQYIVLYRTRDLVWLLWVTVMKQKLQNK